MKFLYNIEKVVKNGFYLDFFFKNFIFFFYKKIIGKNFLFILDKYFTEYIFFFFKSFFNYFLIINNTLKNLTFNQIIKLMIIITIQVFILIIL